MKRILPIFITAAIAWFTEQAMPQAPQIISTYPGQNQINVPDTATIIVTFDMEMDDASINDSTFVVFSEYAGFISGSIVYDSLDNSVNFIPQGNWMIGDLINVVMTSNIMSQGGIPLNRGHLFSFAINMPNGSGSFVVDTAIILTSNFYNIAAADLDNDGFIDITTGNYAIWNNGDGTFSSTTYLANGHIDVCTGDFDRDGFIDIATFSESRFFIIQLNNGDRTFSPGGSYFTISSCEAILTHDFNGDGYLDIAVIVRITNSGYVRIFFNNGDGTFAPFISYDTDQRPNSFSAADFNNDFDVDIAVVTYDLSVYDNDGGGNFDSTSIFSVFTASESIAATDFNQDGFVDLGLFSGSIAYHNCIALGINPGNAHFNTVKLFNTNHEPLCIASLDVNGDGNIDIAVANEDSSVSLLINYGNFDFSLPVDYPANNSLREIAAADFDGDGDLDVAATGYTDSTLLIYRNEYVDNPRGSISGFVTNTEGDSLYRATVRLFQDENVIDEKSTSSNGYYDFTNLPLGEYWIKFQRQDYLPQHFSGIVVERNMNTAVNVVLLDEPIGGNVELTTSLFWSYMEDMDIRGDYIYGAFPSGLAVINISDSLNPEIISRLDLSSGLDKIRVSGTRAYAISENYGVFIFDVANVYEPHIINVVPSLKYAMDLAVRGDTIFLADENRGFKIVDLSNPMNPIVISELQDVESANEIVINEGYAFLMDDYLDYTRIYMIDISNLQNPLIAGDTAFYGTYGTMFYNDGLLFTSVFSSTYSNSRVYIFDVSIPGHFSLLGTYIEYHAVDAVYATDSNLFLAAVRLLALDISDPQNPFFISESQEYFSCATRLCIRNNTAYIPRGCSGPTLSVADISDLNMMHKIGEIPCEKANTIEIVDHYGLVGTPNGLYLIDIQDPENPEIISNDTSYGDIEFMDVSGNRAAVWAESLFIVNIDNILNPIMVGTIDTNVSTVYDMRYFGNYVYLIDFYDLKIFDVSIPDNPTLIGGFLTHQVPCKLDIEGNYLFVTAYNSDLIIVDISNPYNPSVVESLNLGYNYTNGLEVVDSIVFLSYSASTQYGIAAYNLIDLNNPIFLDYYDITYVNNILVENNSMYVSKYTGPFYIFNLWNSISPVFAARYDFRGSGRDIDLYGNYIFYCNDNSLAILNYQNPTGIPESEVNIPERLKLHQNYPNPFNSNTLINYEIPIANKVTLKIYNILGQEVVTLVDSYQNAGPHSVIWNGTNQTGNKVASGIYFSRLSSGDNAEIKKMLLLK